MNAERTGGNYNRRTFTAMPIWATSADELWQETCKNCSDIYALLVASARPVLQHGTHQEVPYQQALWDWTAGGISLIAHQCLYIKQVDQNNSTHLGHWTLDTMVSLWAPWGTPHAQVQSFRDAMLLLMKISNVCLSDPEGLDNNALFYFEPVPK